MRRRGQRGNLRSPVLFRKGLSTHHALKKVEKRVSEALHELPSPGGFCAIIALDVKNVFNSTSWECIYQSLAEDKKMTQYLLRIMDSYLKDRKLTIVTEEGRIATDLSTGVPQGSIKGPFLWTCMYDGHETTERGIACWVCRRLGPTSGGRKTMLSGDYCLRSTGADH